jgi:hypothetical protein
MRIQPDLPPTAPDVSISTCPESPPVDAPVDNTNDPLVCDVPESALEIITSPLVTVDPPPLWIFT